MLSMKENSEQLSASEWWAHRRERYNFGLLVAGLLTFIAYVAIAWTFEERMPDAEITVFTIAIQGVGYLVAMGVANICYFVGPVSEQIIKPGNVTAYREITFRAGYWFSVLLPFSIPALVGYAVATSA
jgi:hypothetical protein